MATTRSELREFETRSAETPEALCRRLRAGGGPTLWLDGSGGFAGGWAGGPLVAVAPRRTISATGDGVPGALEALERRIEERRARGGTSNTGVAVLASYEPFCGRGEPE